MLLLTKLREQRGLSRSELSRRAKMTGPDVGRIESGRLKPYDCQLRKLAKALGIAVEDRETLIREAV